GFPRVPRRVAARLCFSSFTSRHYRVSASPLSHRRSVRVVRLLRPGALGGRARLGDQVNATAGESVMSKLYFVGAVSAALVTAVTLGFAAAKSRSCGGEYMHRSNGKCVNARNSPPTKSWQDEILSRQWKP